MNTLKIENRDLETSTISLRREGIIPGVFYGRDVESTPIKTTRLELQKNMSRGGSIYQIKSGNKNYNVKLESVQKHPVSHEPLHFSLIQLPKGEKSTLNISINLEGEAKGTKEGGTLMVLKETVQLEAQITDMPDSITVDISGLGVGDKIVASDLKLPNGVELIDEADAVIATIKEVRVAAEPEADADAAAEGDAPTAEAQGDAPAAETKEE